MPKQQSLIIPKLVIPKGRPVMLRTSERVSYKRCRQQWYWSSRMGLRSNNPKHYLEFGTLWHESLAAYYIPGRKRGIHPAKTFKQLYTEHVTFMSRTGSFGEEEQEWIDAGELGVGMAENYVDRYGKDKDIEVIQPEMPFFWRMKDSGGKEFIYVGRLDAVIRNLNNFEIGLFEHKTTSSIQTGHLALDEQAGSYWPFAIEFLRWLGIMGPDDDLDMILYNFARKALPDGRPKNDQGLALNKPTKKELAEFGPDFKGSVSKRQPPPLFARVPVYRDEYDSKQVLRRIRLERWEMRMVDEGKLAVYKSPSAQNCNGCQFYNMCELHEIGSDWESYALQNFRVEDGYAEYWKDYKRFKKEHAT